MCKISSFSKCDAASGLTVPVGRLPAKLEVTVKKYWTSNSLILISNQKMMDVQFPEADLVQQQGKWIH